jgi:hypothetical protein
MYYTWAQRYDSFFIKKKLGFFFFFFFSLVPKWVLVWTFNYEAFVSFVPITITFIIIIYFPLLISCSSFLKA